MGQANKPLVLVIVLHAKGLQPISDCLDSVIRSTYENLQVLLVDNGSTDGSVDAVARKFGGRLGILRLSENFGFAKGYNLALKQAQAKYVVLLNDDTTVENEWLAPLVAVAESDPLVGACQPKLRWSKQPSFFEYNGACGGMIDVFGVPFTRGRIFQKTEEDLGQYDTNVDVFWASGAAMFLRLEAMEKAGYLDDTFYAHMEEIDLSWRLRLMGYRIVSVPSSVVYHHGGATTDYKTSFLKLRNNLLMLLKNYSLASLAFFFPARVSLDLVSALYLLAKKHSSRALDFVRSYSWLLQNAKKVWTLRKGSQRLRKIPDGAIVSEMLKPGIVLQYYLMKRSSFSMLDGLPLPRDRYVNAEILKHERKIRVVDVEGVFWG